MASQSHINRWHAFALLAVAFFMTTIDLTIVNTSLPTIGRKLHFAETSLLWVVTAYGLAYGGFLLLLSRDTVLLCVRPMEWAVRPSRTVRMFPDREERQPWPA